MKKKTLSLFLVFLLLLITVGCGGEKEDLSQPKEGAESGMKVTVFDVNGGDAILIQVCGRSLLIDTGYEETAKSLCAALAAEGVSGLDYLLLTHFDKDHIGGVATLLKTYSVSHIIQPVYEKQTTSFYTRYQNAISSFQVTNVTQDVCLTLGGQTFSIYPAASDSYPEDDNDFSLVVKTEYEDVSFLFAGDVEAGRLAEMLRESTDWSATVLKYPHHGSYNKKSDTFLKLVNPSYLLITDSKEKTPSEDLMKFVSSRGWQTYETANGAIRLKTDGKTVTVEQ